MILEFAMAAEMAVQLQSVRYGWSDSRRHRKEMKAAGVLVLPDMPSKELLKQLTEHPIQGLTKIDLHRNRFLIVNGKTFHYQLKGTEKEFLTSKPVLNAKELRPKEERWPKRDKAVSLFTFGCQSSIPWTTSFGGKK